MILQNFIDCIVKFCLCNGEGVEYMYVNAYCIL